MGSEGGAGELLSPVHVAVGRDAREGKSLLDWAVGAFPAGNICLVHVHQPAISAYLSNGKLPGSKLKNRAIKTWQQFERLKLQKHMNQYLLFLSQKGKQADKVWIEASNIEEGILELISQHGIRRLVMGAAVDAFSTRKFPDINPSKALLVCQQAPLSCHIWFVSKGELIYERPASLGPPPLNATMALSPKTNCGGPTTLVSFSRDNMEDNADKVQYLEDPTRSTEDIKSSIYPNAVTVSRTREEGSASLLKVDVPEHSAPTPEEPCTNTSLEYEFDNKEICESCSELEGAMLDAESVRPRTVEESLRQWRAELDALEAVHKSEAAESLCKEEVTQRKEIEELLLKQKQEMETMKKQHDQCLKELQLIEDQRPALESQLRESQYSEKELEEKIIQAVNLLITFKEKRDELQMERDSAVRKINKYRALKVVDPSGLSSTHLFDISFSDIIEASQDFSSSQKIGDGKQGSVFKGTLNHRKVAIKMLPSSGSQSDCEFKNEVEVLSRVRHPNLVTLVGACTESRSLIYEYIENGNLGDLLSSSGKPRLISWQTRIRIAIDICSTLLFLHADHSCNFHGNLKPSNILLDENFVTKISDFGIHNLICANETDPENLAYVDPEFFENGVLTTKSDIYSFGVILLYLLTARPAIGVVRDVNCALERGKLDTVLDASAGEWPLGEAKQLAYLALRCCQKDPVDRPDLLSEVWTVLEPMRELCNSSNSRSQHKVPSHFVCPIYQEVMKDPQIAGDGFTYEGEAIQGWFDSGHKTSPMTNLRLDNCDLLPNHALYYAIQEWLQNT